MKKVFLSLTVMLMLAFMASCGGMSESDINASLTTLDTAYQSGTYEQAQSELDKLDKAYKKMTDEQKTKFDELKKNVEYAKTNASAIKDGLDKAQTLYEHQDYYGAQEELTKLSSNYTLPPAEKKLFDERMSVLNNSIKDWETISKLQQENKTDNATPEDIYSTLSAERRKKLNIFLSNFSEAFFDKYDCNNINADKLISFAFTHDKINNYSQIKWSGSDMGISADRVNTTLNKYLGKTIAKKNTANWRYDGSNYWTSAADGESHDYFSIAFTLIDLKDGTYKVEFNNYYAGYDSMNSKYYQYTNAEAANDSNCELKGSGTAIIRPVSDTWQLLQLNTY